MRPSHHPHRRGRRCRRRHEPRRARRAGAAGPRAGSPAPRRAPRARRPSTTPRSRPTGAKGVHFVSTAMQNGVSLTVIGDTGTTSGAQKLTVQEREDHRAHERPSWSGRLDTSTATQPPSTTSSASPRASRRSTPNEWLSFPTSNSSLERAGERAAQLAGGDRAADERSRSPTARPRPCTASTCWRCAAPSSTESGPKVPVVALRPGHGYAAARSRRSRTPARSPAARPSTAP